MQIHLRRELEDFVQERVRQGHYPTTDAMVEEALALLYDRDLQRHEFTPEHDAYIRQRLARSQEDSLSGRVASVDDAGLHRLMSEIMERGRQRLAELHATGR